MKASERSRSTARASCSRRHFARLRVDPCISGGLPRQPCVRAHRAQLQSRHGNGGRHRDRHGGEYCSGRCHRARPCRNASAARRLSHRQRVTMDAQSIIARRVALELRPGNLVNLGIGIPTLVANYVPPDLKVFFQSENGLIARDKFLNKAWLIPCLRMQAAGRSAPCPAHPPSTARCRSD